MSHSHAINTCACDTSFFEMKLSYSLKPLLGAISDPKSNPLYSLSLVLAKNVVEHLSQSFFFPENGEIFIWTPYML
jgi:hypothetical protein